MSMYFGWIEVFPRIVFDKMIEKSISEIHLKTLFVGSFKHKLLFLLAYYLLPTKFFLCEFLVSLKRIYII